MVQEQVSGEVPSWLKTLPIAPEYHPTIQEFQDPISYIFKIEKEASKYGICKIVPPVPPQPKKVVTSNFNCSIAQRNPKSQPTFTTRQQQIGFCPRKQRPVQKSVWQSGEHYTLQEFEARAKNFERNYVKNRAKKAVSALDMETLYWKATGDRPISVEYANDMPGSAFSPVKERRWRDSGETGVVAGNVGDTAWNMRGIARSNGSLLRFMKEDIPGVTSPMVYVAMMFSWFAWHVEDHDLHSVNYLHMGAGKTWYGVPRDAAAAFEEVIRVHGYGEEINPLVTFSVLGEKTTVMSPEVLISAGVPCCRLVQNAGEFVVTFPRAYHSGISHGFNVGEASNIATPEWLRFAKDAAIRRASINYPPMVSHFQLLYDLALDLSSSNPSNASTLPRSSRLKNKKRGKGETLVKQLFLEDIIQNNNLLHTLGKGSAVVLLPQNPSERFICSNLRIGSRYNVKSGVPLHLSSSEGGVKSPKGLASDDLQTENQVDKRFKAYYSRKAKFSPMDQRVEFQACIGSNEHTSHSNLPNSENTKGENTAVNGMHDRGLFSCVKCGIWPFACVAMVQPTESTSRYLMSTEFDINVLLALGELNDGFADQDVCGFAPSFGSGAALKNASRGRCHVPVESAGQFERTYHSTKSSDYEFEKAAEDFEGDSDAEIKKSSALGLLALTYGNSSDSDEDEIPCHSTVNTSGDKDQSHHVVSPSSPQDCATGVDENLDPASLRLEDKDVTSHNISNGYKDSEFSRVDPEDSGCGSTELAGRLSNHNAMKKHGIPSSTVHGADTAEIINSSLPFLPKPDEDSSRIHVFCLEHAAELEQLLRPIGGVQVMLLCHPDYPKVQDAAKLVAKELAMEHEWNDTPFKIASKDDEEHIQMALHSEEETPKSGDWAVKLGINLYYSSVLCRSPLYSKQMPYNSVIYSLFGCRTPSASPKDELKVRGKRSSRQRKVIMAGKWCGKVWMTNQVHPLLVNQETDGEEEEGIFPISRMKNEEKILEDSKPPTRKAGISSKPRTATKRKSKFEDKSTKKTKSQDDEIAVSGDFGDSVDTLHRAGKRTIKNARCSDIGFAESDSEDSMEEHKKTVAKKMIKKARTSDPEIEEDFEPEPLEEELKRHQGYARSIRSQRFKGKTRPYQTFNCHVAADQCGSSSESEPEGGPSSRLRKRSSKPEEDSEEIKAKKNVTAQGPKMRLPTTKGPKMRFPTMTSLPTKGRTARVPVSKARAVKDAGKKAVSKAKGKGEEYVCDIEGCNMSFRSEEDLSLHKRNICPVEDCYKKFFSHKYLVQHRRVHEDDRPLKCPWKGCKMTFKWAWARTEHIRVHTGARPYVCKEPGCGQTFRFVSDFSRHKRKTGHSIRKKA